MIDRLLRFRLALLIALACLVIPGNASAQSAIAGVVTDSTGGVLPGVTVEARSPALIEQVRTAVTDGQGAYRIIDLRPGTYSVTFVLPGFSTFVRQEIRLEADFTAPISVVLRVGAVSETVTVSGVSPMVDVQTTSSRDVLSREMIETLPTGRNYQTVMQRLPAVSSQGNVRFEVGGSSVMQQSTGAAYGGQAGDFNLTIDNMTVSTPIGQGDRPGLYINDGGFEESVYTVSGGGAEVATPGIKVNLIPKQGGNQFKGQLLTLFANGATQSHNISQKQIDDKFAGIADLYRSYDVNASFGGPIRRDRLWFFTSYRRWSYNNMIPALTDVHDSNLSTALPVRLTAQITPKHKITGVFEKTCKERLFTGIESGNVSIEATGWQACRQHYYTQEKLTSTFSNRLLFQAGYSFTRHDLPNPYRDGTNVSSVFPYGAIRRTDLTTQKTWGAPPLPSLIEWWNHFALADATYVTGTHALKVGLQFRSGRSRVTAPDTNSSLTQRYRLGAADSVIISGVPIEAITDLNADTGVFVQDSWTMGRLTLNPGFRYDYYHGEVPEQNVGAGRFLPARHFDAITDLPSWKDYSFRLGAAYNLFGDGKTAIKGTVGRYMQQEAIGFIENFNPQLNGSATGGRPTDTRTWKDLNTNDIAEEDELGPTTNSQFGVARIRNPNPDIERTWQILYNLSIDHELLPGVAVSASYNRRNYYDLSWTDNLLVTNNDYDLIQIADPRGNGKMVPLWNIHVDKQSAVDLLDLTSANNQRWFNGVDVGINARFPNGAFLFGGTSTGRTTSVACDQDNPNGSQYCDERNFSNPLETNFKLNGTYPLPHGVTLSASFQDQIGNQKVLTYSVGRAVVPSLTLASVNVRLTDPGSLYYDRVRMLDVSAAKTFEVRNLKIRPKIEAFNLLNANPVLAEVTAYGTTLGQPTEILGARLVRFGLTVDF